MAGFQRLSFGKTAVAAAAGVLFACLAVLEPAFVALEECGAMAVAAARNQFSSTPDVPRGAACLPGFAGPSQVRATAEHLARSWRDQPVDDRAPAVLYPIVAQFPEVVRPAAVEPAAFPRSISVVMCSVDARRYDAACRSYAAALGDWPVEFVGIQDARSLAEGFSRGLSRSSADWVIFSHDDVGILSPDLGPALGRALSLLDIVGVVGTTRLTGPAWGWSGRAHGRGRIIQPNPAGRGYGVHALSFPEPVTGGLAALDGVFFAAHRETASRVGFDAVTFDGFHLYDLDFSYRAAREGLRVGVSQDIVLRHDSLGEYEDSWRLYAARFQAKFSLPAVAHSGPPLPRGILFADDASAGLACQRVDWLCRAVA